MSWLIKECVIVPVDFSDESFAALVPAIEFVKDASHIHIVHILPTLQPGDPALMWAEMSPENRIEHVRNSLSEKFSGSEYVGINIGVEIGEPGTEIVNYAKKHEADLIVLSTHGRTGIDRFLVGSVAERVVRFSHCPVLVIH